LTTDTSTETSSEVYLRRDPWHNGRDEAKKEKAGEAPITRFKDDIALLFQDSEVEFAIAITRQNGKLFVFKDGIVERFQGSRSFVHRYFT